MVEKRELVEAITATNPEDERELSFRREMLELASSEGDPTSRDHFAPGHFTASGFVLSPDGTSMLLIHHGKLNRWLQPGGHIDPEDRSIFEAIRRELREETGVTELELVGGGLFDLDVHVIPARKGDPDHKHFDLRALFRASTLEIAAGSDAVAAKWVPLEEVSQLESDESVMRAVAKLLAGAS